jgi:hypothetical protein
LPKDGRLRNSYKLDDLPQERQAGSKKGTAVLGVEDQVDYISDFRRLIELKRCSFN